MAQKFTLSSGMRLLVEPLPHLRSIASGLWVNCGSVYEQTAINGVSHFLEHMLFKGTSPVSYTHLDVYKRQLDTGSICTITVTDDSESVISPLWIILTV